MAKSVRKDVKNIFEIIKLSRILKTSFKNTVFIVIRVAYGIEVFESISNIELVY